MITRDTIIKNIIEEYPWIVDKIGELAPEYQSMINSPLFRLVQNKTVGDLCTQFNLDETKTLYQINSYLNRWIGEKTGNILFKDLKEGRISTSTLTKIIDQLIGEGSPDDERAVLRIAVLASKIPVKELTKESLIYNIQNLDYLMEGTPWIEVGKNIPEQTRQKVIQKLS